MKVGKQNCRQVYETLLKQSVSQAVFFEGTAITLHEDPYFFAGYLEILWNAEERHNRRDSLELLHFAYGRATEIFKSRTLQRELAKQWTSEDVESFGEILRLTSLNKDVSSGMRRIARAQYKLCKNVVESEKQPAPHLGKFLKKLKTIDCTDLQNELNAVAPVWWQLYTGRAMRISHHQHTSAYVLRGQPTGNLVYTPVDGVHESAETAHASKLTPKLRKTINQFAEELDIGLGRVAAVKLDPGMQVYRHYDSEPHYIGRNRYHFILQAGSDNVLSVGNETVNAQPGELYLYDNKAMHRSENRSSVPRIHIIFDGYPLAKRHL